MSARAEYVSYISDNCRWDALELRDGDIVITTPSKSGTTWTQMLVALLIFDGPDLPGPLSIISPWLDMNTRPIGDVVAVLDAQTHRRFIKTHTPLDGLPVDDRVTYVGVGRDPRDVAVSMAFHTLNVDRERLRQLHDTVVAPEAEPVTAANDIGLSPYDRFREWIDAPPTLDGNESLATIIRHLTTIWERRHEQNVALFHYADYQADLPGEMVQLADHLGVDLTRSKAEKLATHASLDAMRARATDLAPNSTDRLWKSDAQFFRSGATGEWQTIFDGDLAARYESRVAQLADPELVRWLHHDWRR
jgi:hypothetical protein